MFSGRRHCPANTLQCFPQFPAFVGMRGSLLNLGEGSLGIFFHRFRDIGCGQQLLNLLHELLHDLN